VPHYNEKYYRGERKVTKVFKKKRKNQWMRKRSKSDHIQYKKNPIKKEVSEGNKVETKKETAVRRTGGLEKEIKQSKDGGETKLKFEVKKRKVLVS